MEQVLGIGGVFFKARDPKALAAWYRKHLGVPVESEQTYGAFTSAAAGEQAVWSAFPADTTYFGSGPAPFMQAAPAVWAAAAELYHQSLARGEQMTIRNYLEGGAFVLLFVVIAGLWLTVPPVPLESYALSPAYLGLVSATAVAPCYLILRLLPRRLEKMERLVLALLLGGMPVIYLWAALAAGGNGTVIITEAIGVGIYGSVAVIGFQRSKLLLGIGIAAHGIAWDSWHHNHAGYIEPWYPVDCLAADLAFGLLVVAQTLGLKGQC